MGQDGVDIVYGGDFGKKIIEGWKGIIERVGKSQLLKILDGRRKRRKPGELKETPAVNLAEQLIDFQDPTEENKDEKGDPAEGEGEETTTE